MQVFLAMIIPFIQKYWVWLLGAIGVFFIVRKLGLGKTNFVNTTYDNIGVTISKQQALAYAENLFNAMKDVGTDEDVLKEIYSILSQNPANVKLVYNAFGFRDYALFGSPVGFWMPSDKVSLKQWIKNETSGTLQNSWMSLFSSAGII